MVFTLITVILLLKDLSQPKRFLNILLRPQWKSWVARGAFILVGFTVVAGLWWLLEGAAYLDWLANDLDIQGFVLSLHGSPFHSRCLL
jgi:formate-dependent nitrite reductase membrane component NrfD